MKHFLPLFFGIISGVSAMAQQTWQWAHNDGTPLAYRNTNGIAADAAGNSYVNGQFNGNYIIFGSDTVFHESNYVEGYIVKHDALGNDEWAIGLHGSGSAVTFGMDCDANGNLVITGVMSGPIWVGTDTLFNTGTNNPDLYIMKFDPNGTLLWAHNYASGFYAAGIAVDFDSNGNILLAGYYSGTGLYFITQQLPTASGEDIFIAQFDPAGNFIAAGAVNDPGNERVYDMKVSPNSSIIITGVYGNSQYVIGTDTLPYMASGNDELFIASFNSSFSPQWAISGTGNEDDIFNSVTVDDYGNIYAAGSTVSAQFVFNGDTISNTVNNEQIIVCMVNPFGSTVWLSEYGGAGTDEVATDIEVDSWNFVTMIGVCPAGTAFGSHTIMNTGSFAVRFNSSGIVLWANEFGPAAPARFCAIDAADQLIVAGISGDTSTFGAITVNALSDYDFFIAKLDMNTAVHEYIGPVAPTVFPNPGSDQITITGLKPDEEVELLSVTGQLLRSVKSSGHILTLDIAHLSSGVYFLHTETTTIRFICE